MALLRSPQQVHDVDQPYFITYPIYIEINLIGKLDINYLLHSKHCCCVLHKTLKACYKIIIIGTQLFIIIYLI